MINVTMIPRQRFKKIIRMHVKFSCYGVLTYIYRSIETLMKFDCITDKYNIFQRRWSEQADCQEGQTWGIIENNWKWSMDSNIFTNVSILRFFYLLTGEFRFLNLFLFLKGHRKSFNLLCSCKTKKGYYFSISKKNNWNPNIILFFFVFFISEYTNMISH